MTVCFYMIWKYFLKIKFIILSYFDFFSRVIYFYHYFYLEFYIPKWPSSKVKVLRDNNYIPFFPHEYSLIFFPFVQTPNTLNEEKIRRNPTPKIILILNTRPESFYTIPHWYQVDRKSDKKFIKIFRLKLLLFSFVYTFFFLKCNDSDILSVIYLEICNI